MRIELGVLAVAVSSLFVASAVAQAPPHEGVAKVLLNVPAGAPLRLYLTNRVSKRAGAPVQAKIMEPVFAFDREVIPASTVALGKVSRTQSVGKWERVRAILNGDFTPLRRAEVEFTTLKLPNGRELATHTLESMGLNSIYIEPSTKKKKKDQKAQPQNQNGGILGTAKQAAKDRIKGAINTRSRGFSDIVRGPNKKEKFVDFLWSKAPYHPQYWRRGTRFDAPLRDPLELGFAPIKQDDLRALGTQPADSVAHVRLLRQLSSASAKQGQSVEALLTAPVFSRDHKLVLPEGTRLTGEVVLARKARHFHRAGQLRFNFQKVDLPEQAANLRPSAPGPTTLKTQAILEAAEASGKAPVEVDSEGGVKAKESKTRFIAPAIALVVASQAGYEGRHPDRDEPGVSVGGGPHVSGRTLGGGLGLGMAGAAIAQTSPYVGMAFGYYGLAWSVYSSVIGRGAEVEFEKNAMMEIKFGARPPGSQFLAASAGQ